MDIGLISLIITIVALFLLPIYSSLVMEWRIKKYTKKYKLDDIVEALLEIADGLENAGFIERGEKENE